MGDWQQQVNAMQAKIQTLQGAIANAEQDLVAAQNELRALMAKLPAAQARDAAAADAQKSTSMPASDNRTHSTFPDRSTPPASGLPTNPGL